MSTFLELAERCEAAPEPDRELDCLILEHVYRERYGRDVQWIDDGEDLRPRCMWVAGGPWEEVPHYASSVDAALTLVPETHNWELDDTGFAKVIVKRDRIDFTSRAATPALAICAAALRARDDQ